MKYLSGMKQNQKYTQEEMFEAIERCKKEGLGHTKYCKQSGIHYQTFRYWLKKYQKEKSQRKIRTGFVPVEISTPVTNRPSKENAANITIAYPNGLLVNCPATISSELLRTLIKF
jgi:transposase-like protein